MYENVTYEVILDRMLNRISDKFDKREGSVIWDACSPAAIEFQILYLELERLIQEAYADTASREFLILRCKERGITPHEATNSVLKGVFSPADIEVIGKRFNVSHLNYIVKEKITDGIYKVECETPGIIGNQYLGNMIPIEYIDGLEKAELTEVLIPGEDEENTEALRKRYFDSFSEKAFGGNRRDYIEKTNAIAGVGSTKVTRAQTPGGNVILTIIDSDYNAASDALIASVQEIIDPLQNSGEGYGLAPIGHNVIVESAKTVNIDVNAEVTFETGYGWDNLQTSVKFVISNYLAELRGEWGNTDSLVVRVSQIETRLLSINGIIDVENLTINGVSKNIVLGEYDIPVIGEVCAVDKGS